MNPSAILISAPAIDFRTFIGLSHKVLGRSPAAPSDACRRELSDAERFLSCLAALRDEHAPIGLSPRLLAHVSFSALHRGRRAGHARHPPTLRWDAIRGGGNDCAGRAGGGRHRHALPNGRTPWCRDAATASPSVRHCFNKLHGLFVAAGLNVWHDFTARNASDQTFLLLEDKRGR